MALWDEPMRELADSAGAATVGPAYSGNLNFAVHLVQFIPLLTGTLESFSGKWIID